ncbi:Ribosomal large subunit pseudouridine(746) synthase @ tRNA pseudouridine(32) synthase [hydrothermal vent metagenome]|uniref:Ribosomal large subunit pseudouridine(746) synthase @ tRNA pseudouridine(32) synthase n=1 Tax=hydrothermal vent metagenome TaxID=652676 RepID=A0A3B1DNM8_9ZZZZ
MVTETSETAEEFPVDRLAKGPADAVRVLGRGQRWVVVEKPVGLLSVPGRGPDKADCVRVRIEAMFPEATGSMTVHRLDMDTSGLMVFALSKKAHAKLSRQFEHRKTGKSYTALLAGDVEGEEGEVNLPLIVDWPNRPRQHVNYERGKPAQTLWRVIGREQGHDSGYEGALTRVEFRPVTGRTHQLRVHAATPRDQGGIGAAILGDTLYGDPESAPRMMLHAAKLSFWEPFLGDWRKFSSEAPF